MSRSKASSGRFARRPATRTRWHWEGVPGVCSRSRRRPQGWRGACCPRPDAGECQRRARGDCQPKGQGTCGPAVTDTEVPGAGCRPSTTGQAAQLSAGPPRISFLTCTFLTRWEGKRLPGHGRRRASAAKASVRCLQRVVTSAPLCHGAVAPRTRVSTACVGEGQEKAGDEGCDFRQDTARDPPPCGGHVRPKTPLAEPRNR